MGRTVLELSSEEKLLFRPVNAIEKRRNAHRRELEERWRLTQHIARQAAKILHEEYQAERVVLFGSGAKRSWFTLWSDIDLAVWGIPPKKFYAAVAAVTRLSSEISIDLVDGSQCSPDMRRLINQYGNELR